MTEAGDCPGPAWHGSGDGGLRVDGGLVEGCSPPLFLTFPTLPSHVNDGEIPHSCTVDKVCFLSVISFVSHSNCRVAITPIYKMRKLRLSDV